MLVIAHRLSTIHNADSIAVINNGNVKEVSLHTRSMYQGLGLLQKTKLVYYFQKYHN